MSNLYTGLPSDLPPQKLSEKEKTKEWREQCVRAVASKRNLGMGMFRKTRQEMQVNYDLVNGKYDPADVMHVINPTNNPNLEKMGGLPARFQHYDIISSKLNELIGEEIKRPFNFRAYGVSGGVMSRQKEKREQLILQGLHNLLMQEQGLEAQGEEVPLEKVEEYFKTKYKDPAEVGANQILKSLVPKQKMHMKFVKGFTHVVSNAEEIYYVGVVGGEPVVRVGNPMYCEYDLDPDLDFIEDGQWFSEQRHMSPGSAIDEYREHLTSEQVSRLDGRHGRGGYSFQEQIGFVYQPGTEDAANMEYYRPGIDPGNQGRGSTAYGGSGDTVSVVNVCWRSLREVGFLTYPDENGKLQEQLVDPQDVKLTKQQKVLGYKLETQWITDIWEGTVIDEDIYVNIRPLPYQTGKLPYFGHVYNRLNSRATSLVDRVKALQYLYNVTWFRLEMELAKAKGRSVAVDMAMIPRTGEWAMDTDQWLHYKDTVGIMWYDSTQEGNEGREQRQIQMANASVDQGLSSNVAHFLGITKELREMVGDIMGVSRQREGNVTSNETVGGVDHAITQSNNITEPLFFYHGLVKQNVLTQAVEVAKICYADGLHGQYIVDDVYREWLNVDGGLLNDSTYEVYIRDSSKDAAIIQKMEAMADRMFQSGEVRASTILGMLDMESISEMKAHLLQAEDAKDARDAQQAQMQQQQHDAQLAQAAQLDAANKQFEATENALDRENDIRKAYISATKGAQGDANLNGSPDGLDFIKATSEQGKLNLAQLKAATDAAAKQSQLQLQAQKDAVAASQKDQDLRFKLTQHADKTALESQKLQLQVADMEMKRQMFAAEQAANQKEQAQQNKMHADKMKMDKEAAILKNKELKIKMKMASKPKPKSK